MDKRLIELLKKYSVSPPGMWCLIPMNESSYLMDAVKIDETVIPLFPWRYERRFVELRNMVQEQTVGRPLMCRFSALVGRDGPSLSALLCRELDLLEWITGMKINDVLFVSHSQWCTDGIVHLEGGPICSIEIGRTLPLGTPKQGRHELITNRGIACDLVVDTQVAQSSVYGFTDQESFQFTDVDNELFGLNAEEAAVVRSAFDVLRKNEIIDLYVKQYDRIKKIASSALESDMRHVSFGMNGGVA